MNVEHSDHYEPVTLQSCSFYNWGYFASAVTYTYITRSYLRATLPFHVGEFAAILYWVYFLIISGQITELENIFFSYLIIFTIASLFSKKLAPKYAKRFNFFGICSS